MTHGRFDPGTEVEEATVGGVRYAVGDRVRLRPGADASMLDGTRNPLGTIERIYRTEAEYVTLRVELDAGTPERLFVAPADVEPLS